MYLSNALPNIAVLILAAGASSRMGSPKQLLKWGTSTLLGHSIQTVLESQASSGVVVLGAHYKQVKQSIDQFPVTILNNTDWKQGLGKSIACGVLYIMKHLPETEGVLVVLADQPFVDTAHVNTLIESFKPNKKEIIATAYGEGKQGVPVLFDKMYFKMLVKLNDDGGAKRLLKPYNEHVHGVKPPSENLDIDDPEDYKRFS